jgi:hypothetical protein
MIRVQTGPTGRRARDLAQRIAGSGLTPLEKIKAVHDWIILNTAYDVEAAKQVMAGRNPSSPTRKMQGVFENGLAICTGYAEAAQTLLGELEVEAITVHNDDHAWNMVQLDGAWYHLDVTWDDPVPDEPGRVVYNYFLVSDGTLSETRAFEPSAAHPAPQDLLARTARWNGLPVVHSLDEVRRGILSAPAACTDIQMYLWRLDGDQAIRTALAAATARGAHADRAGGLLETALRTFHVDLPLRGPQRLGSVHGPAGPWQAAWSGTPHFKHLQVTTGDVRFDRRPMAVAGIRRPWIRLRCGAAFCTLFSATPGSLRLARGTIQSAFPALQDGKGHGVYEYFSPDMANVEFRLDPALGWQVRVPAEAPNGFLLRPASGKETLLGPTFTQLELGSRLVLFSRRQGKAIEAASFQVVEA